jgi:hypothetical protein
MIHRNYHEITGISPAACGRELGRLFGPVVRKYVQVERTEQAWHRRRRAAGALLASTQSYFPAYVEELQAYAQAAGVPLLDLWTMSVEDELDDGQTEKCTTVVTNGGRLIIHNEDWDADAADDICIVRKTCRGVTTLELYYYGCPLGGTALSICSRGYVQAINSLDHSGRQRGVPKVVIARRLSELRDLNAELDAVLAVPRSSGFSHNLVHYTGSLTSVECTATRYIAHRPAIPFVHTNHLLHPTMSDLEGAYDGRGTFRRYDAACNLARSSMAEDEVMRLVCDETNGSTDSIFNRNTIARAIVDLDRRIARFWLKRESKKGWVEYPIDFLFGGSKPSV